MGKTNKSNGDKYHLVRFCWGKHIRVRDILKKENNSNSYFNKCKTKNAKW